MIFVMLGTQKQNFKRLLEEIENCKILDKEEIVVQAGYTKFTSSKMRIIDFLQPTDFENCIESSEFVITHGGVGSIFSALLKQKKVIAVPRLKKYGEHVDNHQVEICKKLASLNYIVEYNPDESKNVEREDTLEEKINFLRTNVFQHYVSDNSYLGKLNDCIEELSNN